MLSAFNTPERISKEELLESLRNHRDLDRFVQRHGYWWRGVGCAIGCSIVDFHESLSIDDDLPQDLEPIQYHTMYESLFGISRHVASIQDALFEGLPSEIAHDFPIRFVESVNIGANLNDICLQFMQWLTKDPSFSHHEFDKISELGLYMSRIIYPGEDSDVERYFSERWIPLADKLIELVSACQPTEQDYAGV